MTLKNMKLTPEEAKDASGCCAPGDAEYKGPAYPYGLCLYLDDKTLEKLGFTSMPDVGTKLQLTAIVEVTSNSQRQNQDGKTSNMDLQITDMELEPEATPIDAKAFYPKSSML